MRNTSQVAGNIRLFAAIWAKGRPSLTSNLKFPKRCADDSSFALTTTITRSTGGRKHPSRIFSGVASAAIFAKRSALRTTTTTAFCIVPNRSSWSIPKFVDL